MHLNALDWMVVAACLAAALTPALLLARRAGRGTVEFFASGRAAPWWLAGTSMVATTFSTDTPNLVADLVRSGGVSGNWVWWAFLLTGMTTVFFFARLWRRSGVLTDLEFYELRYSGRPAAFVRGFRAVYLGVVFNVVIMGTVTLAAVKIGSVLLGLDRWQTVLICSGLCIAFSALSGLWGVMASDVVQFAIAMIGVIAAATVILDDPRVGGLTGLVAQLDPATLAVVPDLRAPDAAGWNWEALIPALILPLTVQWWSTWYPGAEPGGGSYVAQRMLAARNERHALGATLWFNVAHYALRPWPWILVALASMVIYPTIDDLRRALPHVDPGLIRNDIAYPAMLTLLPHGLLGLLVASLLAAYISTMSTHLNWGASYLVNDLYRRFIRAHADERHYVAVSRGVTVGLMILSGIVVFRLDTAGDAFNLLLSIGAGTGLLYMLRWYWWRINAWSEIAAMVASLGMTVALMAVGDLSSSTRLVLSVGCTTAVWLLVTWITAPVDGPTLQRFYLLVRPAGPGWRAVRTASDLPASADRPAAAALACLAGCALVYGALFGTGYLLYGRPLAAGGCGLIALGGAVVVARGLARPG